MTETDYTDVPAAIENLGPIDYLLIEFPGDKTVGEGLPLFWISWIAIIRVFDLVFLRKGVDGLNTSRCARRARRRWELDLGLFEGARSGLFGDDDLAAIAEAVTPGCTAAVLMYENTWAAPLAVALRRGGGQLVASGRIPVQRCWLRSTPPSRRPDPFATHPLGSTSRRRSTRRDTCHARTHSRSRPYRSRRGNGHRGIQPRFPSPGRPLGRAASPSAGVRASPRRTRLRRRQKTPWTPSLPSSRNLASCASAAC